MKVFPETEEEAVESETDEDEFDVTDDCDSDFESEPSEPPSDLALF